MKHKHYRQWCRLGFIWAVLNKNSEFEFSKEAYDTGLYCIYVREKLETDK